MKPFRNLCCNLPILSVIWVTPPPLGFKREKGRLRWTWSLLTLTKPSAPWLAWDHISVQRWGALNSQGASAHLWDSKCHCCPVLETMAMGAPAEVLAQREAPPKMSFLLQHLCCGCCFLPLFHGPVLQQVWLPSPREHHFNHTFSRTPTWDGEI